VATQLEKDLSNVVAVLGEALDIVDAPVHDPTEPSWSARRGWTSFLRQLDDAALDQCERVGLAARAADLPGAPESLVRLAARVRLSTQLPTLDAPAIHLPKVVTRGVSARKREQLAALLGAVAPMATAAARIVDIGAGSGHFTRLSALTFERSALGVDRNERLAAAARERTTRSEFSNAGNVEFVVADATSDELALSPTDLAVGLHACGALGDRVVVAAGRVRCDVALVSCCLQKIGSDQRSSLSTVAASLRLRRDTLGLANLTAQPTGIETSIEDTLLARETRYALRCLLLARGISVEPGAEMRGINRRRAHRGLSELAREALVLRGLAPASASELAWHGAVASQQFRVMRRWSLPRHMLASLVEVAVVLDRAVALEEAGLFARVGRFVNRAATPRNLAVFASAAPERLPAMARLEAATAEGG
jgi:SAM-dependent methyltransferase